MYSADSRVLIRYKKAIGIRWLFCSDLMHLGPILKVYDLSSVLNGNHAIAMAILP